MALALADVVEALLAAALVEVDGGGVAVEHQGGGPHGADVAPCTTSAAPTWHLAWGSTARDARELVVLFTVPQPGDRRRRVRHARRPASRSGSRGSRGRAQRLGIDVGHEVTRAEQVSATFEVRSGRVVVERLQQFDGSEGRGALLAPAVPAAARGAFADGEASAVAPTTPPPDEGEGTGEDGADRVSSSERIVV